MNKKILLTVFIVLAIASIVFIVVISRKKEPVLTLTPQKPNFPSSITGNLPIEMSLKKTDFNFPIELPTMSVTQRTLNKSDIETIASKLRMGTDLDEFNDISDGLKYFKSTDTNFFVATPKTSVIKYGLSTSEFPITTNKKIDDEEFTKIAIDFITQNGFYKTDQIRPLPVKYFKTASSIEGLIETPRDSAQLFQIGFTFKSSKYEIVTDHSEDQQIFVQILPDGTIYNSEILLIDNLKEGITNYPLKTYEDLGNSLNQAKLISFSGDYVSPSDFTLKDIVSLKIEKIRLVYFLEKGKSSLLQPIFILEGPAQISRSSADSATLYLPAFK